MFEWVKGSVYTPILTLYPNNITLNSSAASYFQDCRWAMLGIDKEKFQIAIKPVTKRELDLHLITMDQVHKVSIGKGYGRISSKAIMDEITNMMHQQIDGLKINASYDEVQNMLIADFSMFVKKEG